MVGFPKSGHIYMSSDDVHFIHIVKILYTVANLGTRRQVPFATARNTKYSVTKGTKHINSCIKCYFCSLQNTATYN